MVDHGNPTFNDFNATALRMLSGILGGSTNGLDKNTVLQDLHNTLPRITGNAFVNTMTQAHLRTMCQHLGVPSDGSKLVMLTALMGRYAQVPLIVPPVPAPVLAPHVLTNAGLAAALPPVITAANSSRSNDASDKPPTFVLSQTLINYSDRNKFELYKSQNTLPIFSKNDVAGLVVKLVELVKVASLDSVVV